MQRAMELRGKQIKLIVIPDHIKFAFRCGIIAWGKAGCRAALSPGTIRRAVGGGGMFGQCEERLTLFLE